MPEHGHRLHDLEAGRVRGHEDLAHPPVRRRVRVGHRHHDPEARASAEEENHLCPSITHSSPSSTAVVQPRRVGIGEDPVAGHQEERARRPVHERLQEALLLLLRAEEVEDLAVAGVGRLAVEDELRPRAAPDLLVQQRVLDEAGAAAARLVRQVRRPDPRSLRLRAQLLDERVGGGVLTRERGLVR